MSLSAEQKAERVGKDGFVGASEIAAIVGENPFSGPIDVWLRKTGRAEEEPSNPRASIGLRAESLMAAWYAEDTAIMRSQMNPGETVRHPEVLCVGCTPDFLIYEAGANPQYTQRVGSPKPVLSHAMQLKCVGARMALSWPEEWIPPYVECQVQLEAEVLGVERVDVAAYLGGTDWRIVRVPRDREFGAMLVRAARDFWTCVLEDRPPTVDGSESWQKYLAKRYPKPVRQELDEPDATVDEWASLALKARAEVEAAEARQKVADNRLRDLIGDGTGYLGADYVVTWKADKNGKRTLRIKEREFNGRNG